MTHCDKSNATLLWDELAVIAHCKISTQPLMLSIIDFYSPHVKRKIDMDNRVHFRVSISPAI